MIDAPAKTGIPRILVAVDPCGQSLAVLENAAALAERLQAEQARRELQRIGKQRQIATTLKIVRGQYIVEAMSAAASMDVSYLFRMGHTGTRFSGAAKLLTSRRINAHRPVWLFYDGSAAAQRALAMARQLTEPDAKDLIILLPPIAAAAGSSLQHDVNELLGDQSPSARFSCLAHFDLAHLLQSMQRGDCSLLLVARDNALLTASDTQRLIGAVEYPIVLIS